MLFEPADREKKSEAEKPMGTVIGKGTRRGLLRECMAGIGVTAETGCTVSSEGE